METFTASQLREPKSLEKRKNILNRDNFRCTCCGNDRADLKIYPFKKIDGQQLWEYKDHHLTTLCSCCYSFAELSRNIHGFDIRNIQSIYLNVPKTIYSVRMYKLGETVLFYLFDHDNMILRSYDLSASAKELSEFLK